MRRHQDAASYVSTNARLCLILAQLGASPEFLHRKNNECSASASGSAGCRGTVML